MPHVDEWEAAREFPRELYPRAGELGFLGLKYPEELGGQGGDYVHDAVWAEELAVAGASGGVGAGLGAHRDRDAADLRFGTAGAARALPAPGDRAARRSARSRSPSPAAAPTSRRIRTRAPGRRRLRRQRLEDVHHERRPRRLRRLRRRRRPPTGGHHGHLVPDPRARDARLRGRRASSRRRAGARPTPRELVFADVEVPAENLLGDENGGFYLIMANFPWERLLWRSARSSRSPAARESRRVRARARRVRPADRASR